MVLLLSCIGIYNRCQRKPVVEKVERDTVVVYDTVPQYYPVAKDSAVVRYVTKVLPVVKYDTVFRENSATEHFADSSNMMPVVIPITTKHYRAMEYDAWVSGYEPSLDSIKVYQKTEVVTATITKIKPPNKWELDIVGGIDYNIKQQRYTPHAGGELLYKPNRLQVGIRGGVVKADKVEPYVGGVVRFRIY